MRHTYINTCTNYRDLINSIVFIYFRSLKGNSLRFLGRQIDATVSKFKNSPHFENRLSHIVYMASGISGIYRKMFAFQF